MNTPETRNLIEEIDNRTSFNRWIYIVGFVILLACLIISTIMTRISFNIVGTKHDEIVVKTDSIEDMTIKNRADIEANNKQYLNYIASQIQVIDKLQKDNRTVIRVPRALPPPPPGNPLPSDQQLERPSEEHPITNPQTKTIIQKKNYRSKPTPTPRPWYNFFKTTR